jgi:hypothetical protein
MKNPDQGYQEMRRYLADTFAMVMFSTIVGALVEVVIAGLTLEQSARIRLAAIPVMLFTGRPYGIYRNWLFRLFGNKNASRLKATVIDTVANTTFQVPLYCCLLALNGASIGQMVTAVGSITIIAILSGRPYGVFLVWCRKLFGVPASE